MQICPACAFRLISALEIYPYSALPLLCQLQKARSKAYNLELLRRTSDRMHTTSSRPSSPILQPAPIAQPFKTAVHFRSHPASIQGSALERATRLGNTVMAKCGVCATSEEYQTFTNTEGKVLTDIAENVWAAERPFKWTGIDVNGRMAVLRLKDGGLWVQSPVGLDKNLKDALAKLGPVKHIVSPNYEHVKFAKQWQEAYPEAKLYACPGLQQKSDVKYDKELSSNELSPPEWLGEVECACLSYERNPFTGSPFFNEVVFHHKPSKYMIVTDLYWRYPKSGTPTGTQLWKFGMDRIYGPFYRKFMIGDKGDFRNTTQTIFDSWNFEGIIPCHGDVLQSGGKAVLRQHLGLA